MDHPDLGWVAVFSPPADGAGWPSFPELRAHVAARLESAPFPLDRHVRHAVTGDLDGLADAALSATLPPDGAGWRLWIADELYDGRMALVARAGPGLLDALLDPTPHPGPLGRAPRLAPPPAAAVEDDDAGGLEAPAPEPLALLWTGMRHRLGEPVRALRALGHPREAAASAQRVARALAGAVLPAPAPLHLTRLTWPAAQLPVSGPRGEEALAAVARALRTAAVTVQPPVRGPRYRRGCRLDALWPVAAPAGRGVSVSVTAVGETTCVSACAPASSEPLAERVGGALEALAGS